MNNSIALIKKYNKNISEKKILKIRYGLEGTYLTISKFIIISIISLMLGVFKEFLIFTIFYNIIRMFAFGLHASKSYLCLIISSIIFIISPLVASMIKISIIVKIILSIFLLISVAFYAPADTYKRPLINKIKRLRLKVASIIVTITYIILILFINNDFISNVILFSLITEVFLILPITYKLFKLPYKNHASYVRHYN